MLFNIIDDDKCDNGFQYVIIKLIDFGWSKINIGRNPKAKKNDYIYGTLRYTSQEVIKSTMKSMKTCAFKVGVYFFCNDMF